MTASGSPRTVIVLDRATYVRLVALANAERVPVADMMRRLVVDGEVLRGRRSPNGERPSD